MNKVAFTLSCLNRVLNKERDFDRWFSMGDSDGAWINRVPQKVMDADSPAPYLIHRSLLGKSSLDQSAIITLFKEAAFGTLIVAAREQGMDADAVNALLLAQGWSQLSYPSKGIEMMSSRQRRLSATDFPCDAHGHNSRWYARLFTHLRPRFASEYRKLETVLKQAGCPHPIKEDSEGLTVDDYIRSVLPKRSEYLAVDISGGADATGFPVAYLDRDAGERMARCVDKSNTLLFRLVDGGPTGCDAYIGVFTLTCGQMANIVGCVKRSYPWERFGFSVDPSVCRLPSRRNLPWTPREEGFDALRVDLMLAELRKKTQIASFDIPSSAIWLRACRAGTSSLYNNGSNKESDCQELGWTGVNSCFVPHPIGLKRPNAYGLYDMHGNVGECCWRRAGDMLTYEYRGGSFVSVPGECTSNSVCEWMGSANRMGIRLAIYLS